MDFVDLISDGTPLEDRLSYYSDDVQAIIEALDEIRAEANREQDKKLRLIRSALWELCWNLSHEYDNLVRKTQQARE